MEITLTEDEVKALIALLSATGATLKHYSDELRDMTVLLCGKMAEKLKELECE